MCGRYITGELSWPRVHDLLGMPVVLELEPRPRYNIAPSTGVPVLRAGEAGLHLSELRWGAQPEWAKSLLINAQSEKYAGSSRSYWKGGWSRCIFPALGYYEWQKVQGQKTKQPTVMHDPDGAPLAMAGLWRPWDDALGAVAVILTTGPAPDIAHIHHRMPALLPWSEGASWLDPERPREDAAALLIPREGLATYAVSTRVNRVAEDDAGLLDPQA